MSERLRVAAIGTAWAAVSPLPALSSHPGVSLEALCSARIERARDTAERFGVQRSFDDFEAMIDEVRPDIVYVGAPVGMHAPMIAAAVAADAHVISEKPLAIDAAEAHDVVESVRTAGVAHAAAFTMRFFPGPATIKRLVGEGAIGEVRHVAVSYWFAPPVDVPPVWGWLHDRAAGGGLLAAMGSHYLDLLRWWFGELTIVSGSTRTWLTEVPDHAGVMHRPTADDAFAFSAALANGALVTMHASSGVAAPLGPRIEILGTEGSLLLEGLDALSIGAPGSPTEAVALDDPIVAPDAAACDSPRFGMVISGLLDRVDGSTGVGADFVDALAVQQAIDAIRDQQ